MNATEAINKIASLLNLNSKVEKFMVTKLEDGTTEVSNNKEGDFMVDDTLYIVQESTLKPAPEGTHTTREGLKLYVDSASKIVKIESASSVDESETEEEVETTSDMMSSSVLSDGTKIETDEDGEFKVGQQLYFITESGERVKAPSGEHTTESGITIVTDGEGIITGVKYPDSTGEGSLGEDKNEMKKMKEVMSEMVGLLTELNKFKTDFESIKKDFEEFKKQPDRKPVVKSSFAKENILDWKLELLKSSKK
jgi:flagellar basal body rod protein FlgG